MPLIDLHIHTKCSDGTSTPAEVMYVYIKSGVLMMAVTDHDTAAAIPEASQRAAAAGIPFIPGIEISTREHDYLHILGYGIDIDNEGFNTFLSTNRENRFERVRQIVKKLQAYGLVFTEEDVFSLVQTTPSRAHVADALRRRGIVSSRQEAFQKYLVLDKPGYVPSPGPSAEQAIAQIKKAGGKAFIAHPGIVRTIWDFPRWATAGLDGIEVYYPSHSLELRQELSQIAKKYNLLISGGSDHHGEKSGRDNKPGMEVPQKVFDTLKETFLCK